MNAIKNDNTEQIKYFIELEKSSRGAMQIGLLGASLYNKFDLIEYFINKGANNFNDALIIGETYTITNYVSGDDFSNIANVISGVTNETGCEFIATGSTPSVWTNSSELSSLGELIYDVLENNLGYDIDWFHENEFGFGIYYGVPSVIGLKYNNFPKEKSYCLSNLAIQSVLFQGGLIYASSGSLTTKDDVLGIISSANFSADIPYKVLSKLIFPLPGICDLCESKNKLSLPRAPYVVSLLIYCDSLRVFLTTVFGIPTLFLA
jgi:hypothetical protein